MIAGMVQAGLSPSDPVRWFLAYSIETEIAEEDSDDGEVTLPPNAR